MKNVRFIFGMLLVCMLCATPAWSVNARHVAFLKAAQDFIEHHKYPDGKVIDEENINSDFGLNQIAIIDVNRDGKPELLIKFSNGTPVRTLCEYVCGFNEKTKKITIDYIGYPDLEYFNNGCIKEYAMRFKGYDSVYSFAKYNDKKKKYENNNEARIWNKKRYPDNPNTEEPFPDEIDVTGDGFVYFIQDSNIKRFRHSEEPVDTPAYKAWVKKYIGGAKQIDVEWFPANSKGIKNLKAKLSGLPMPYPPLSADVIYDKMLKVAQDYVVKHIPPIKNDDDDAQDNVDYSKIKLAIADVESDGKPELLIRNIAKQSEDVYGFNEDIEEITTKYARYPSIAYYTNGYMKYLSLDIENLLGGEKFPPYSFIKYDKVSDSYNDDVSVVIWSKDASPTNPQDDNKPFPMDIDKTGDGLVYFIYDFNFKDAWLGEKAVDTPIYKAWVKKYIGDAKPIQVDWVPATEDGIKILEAKRH